MKFLSTIRMDLSSIYLLLISLNQGANFIDFNGIDSGTSPDVRVFDGGV